MIRRFLWSASVALAAVSALAPAGAAAQALYTLTRVAPPPGWDKIELHAVNNAGDAAGRVYNRWPYRGAPIIRHADGRIELLPRPGGCLKSGTYRAIAYNDQGQLLLDHCNGVRPAWRWTPGVGWDWLFGSVGGTRALGMNNRGTVVGATSSGTGSQGFVWNDPGDQQLYSRDGGLLFNAINDRGDIAATVYHIADPDLPYDRDGVTAALIPHGGGEPVLTGDGNIDTAAEYKNPEHFWYHVRSHAFGINGRGEIVLDSPATWHSYVRTSCHWRPEERMVCADLAFRRQIGDSVGIDGAGNATFTQRVEYPHAYVMRPDGTISSLGQACDPPYGGELVARGMSESGFVVGRLGGGIGRRTDAFILTRTP